MTIIAQEFIIGQSAITEDEEGETTHSGPITRFILSRALSDDEVLAIDLLQQQLGDLAAIDLEGEPELDVDIITSTQHCTPFLRAWLAALI